MLFLKSYRQRAALHRQDEDEFAAAYALRTPTTQAPLPRQRQLSVSRPRIGATAAA
jgi:hypothetical protein